MIHVDERRIEFRVSVTPCHGGEKAVLRLISPNANLADLGNLILLPPLEAFVRHQFQSRSGLILVTGPTGSGKTTTLYAALNSVVSRNPFVNVVTIEDPVEYDLPFAAQIQVNSQAGMDFATILRTVLRQDPDVILVGEIRDPQSAALAVEAATTGHLVLSSLHTHSALEAIIRLRDLQVEPYMIGAALKAVISQQLIPKLAPGYTEEVPPDDALGLRLQELGVLDESWQGMLLRGRDTHDGPPDGEKGRVALFEMLAVNPALRAAIECSGTFSELESCLDDTSFASFAAYARFVLTEGLVAPERIEAVLPRTTGTTLGR